MNGQVLIVGWNFTFAGLVLKTFNPNIIWRIVVAFYIPSGFLYFSAGTDFFLEVFQCRQLLEKRPAALELAPVSAFGKKFGQ